jgi:hypothetical protein
MVSMIIIITVTKSISQSSESFVGLNIMIYTITNAVLVGTITNMVLPIKEEA